MRCSVAYLHVIVYIFSGLGTCMCAGYTGSPCVAHRTLRSCG